MLDGGGANSSLHCQELCSNQMVATCPCQAREQMQMNEIMFIIELVPPSNISQLKSYTDKICNLLPLCKRFSIASKPSPDITGFEKGVNLVRMLRDLQHQELEIIFHVTCRDLNRASIEARLLELHRLKIEKILVITGDGYEPAEVGIGSYESSLELLADVVRYSCERFKWIAVGGYPGGNGRQSHDNVSECERLSSRLEIGANVVLTQCVFDSGCYDEFSRMIRERDSKIKLIPSVALFSDFVELNRIISLTRVNDLGSAKLNKHLKTLEKSHAEKYCQEFLNKLCQNLASPHSIVFCTFGRLDLARSLIQRLNSSGSTS